MTNTIENTKPDRMEFRRIGGSYQPLIKNKQDLALLLNLDEAHWALNSAGVASLRCDEQFLSFLDDDANGQIRSDEVKRAIGWFLGVMRDFTGFELGSDTLNLNAIDNSTPTGQRLLDAAKLVLANLGQDANDRISLSQIRNDKEIFACARQNGDGVIPPGIAGIPEAIELANLAMKTFGEVKDACGSAGINSEIFEKCIAAANAYLSWVNTPDRDSAGILPFGSDTATVYKKYLAIKSDIDDYFVACDALNFSSKIQQKVGETGVEVNVLDQKSVQDFLLAAPVTEPRQDGVLDFSTRLNPLKSSALQAFASDANLQKFFPDSKLTEAMWRQLKLTFSPYAAFLAAKPEETFGDIDVETLRKLVEIKNIKTVRDLIASDLAAAPRIGACEELHKLILFQNHLREFLSNFVNLSCLFNPETPSLLQAGKLVMDGRCFTLCSIVKDVAEHKNVVKLSDICVIYLDAVTGKPGALKTMKLAVAVTSGNIRNFFIAKHGIFFAADGELWDAKIIDLIQQPVSVSEALRMPFYKFAGFIGNQADRFFSSKSQAAQKQLETNIAKAETKVSGAKIQTPAVSGSMMLMGGGIGIAALGSSIAFIVKQLASVSIWNVLAVLFGIVLVFGGPVVVISIVKLYRRNLSRFLEANGFAVNRPMRLSCRMGAIFTFVPPIPNSDYLKRDIVDLFGKPRHSWFWRTVLILLVAALCAWVGYRYYCGYL
ncbi:MAG: hypothetical protein LBM70_05455 [Victivallales bacterium]|jgi:hypothetical protein|nr:hypothetical protein [Victivallales bacterium]